MSRRKLKHNQMTSDPETGMEGVNDFALQKSIRIGNQHVNNTHRLWKTPYRVDKGEVFTGIVRAYDGTQWRLLHHILPDIDAAAEALVLSLQNTTQLKKSCKTPLVESMIGQFPVGGSFFTRGELWLLDLTGLITGTITASC